MRQLIWVLLLFAGISAASAQDVYTSSGKPGYHKKVQKKKKGYDPEKLIIGGGLNLDYGGDYALLGASPIVGYRFTDHFSAGVGLGFLYFKLPDLNYYDPPRFNYFDEGNLIYPNLWARYFVFRNVFLSGSVEYDIISGHYPVMDNLGNIGSYKENVTATSLLLGIGLKQPLGGRVSLVGQVQHECLGDKYSPYSNQPIILNIGICAGL